MKQLLNDLFESFKVKATCVSYDKIQHFNIFNISINNGCKIKDVEKFATEYQLKLGFNTKPLFILKDGLIKMIFAGKQNKIYLTKLLQSSSVSDTEIIIGIDYQGNPIKINFTKMPHAIVAGTTGSGKSMFLHSIISNFLLSNKNADICLFDPKYVEFERYKKINNSNISFLIENSYSNSMYLLNQIRDIMENRFLTLSKLGYNSIEEYNNDFPNKLNYIICIIDEFADFIFKDNKSEFENLICTIAARARAAGIHLIISTQRPSNDVVTGLIKANFPTRICFKVASAIDSRVVLDQTGAENLNFGGDGIIIGQGEMTRFQSTFIDKENV